MTGTCKSKAPALLPAWLAALAIALTVLISGTVRAETVAIDDQVSVVESDVARPGRGMTMKSVEAKFGAPQERHPAVGKPAITRWDYPAFSVFFENEHVIHAVVNPGT
jgi:hypothetical protein